MNISKGKSIFFGTEEAEDVKLKLQLMLDSTLYNTASSYTTNEFKYPDNIMPFVDKHMNYLNAHPKVDRTMYLANLRLMTRSR